MATKSVEVHCDSNNPTRLWQSLKGSVKCDKVVNPLGLDTPINEEQIRVVCISDTHCQLGKMLDTIPPGHLLIHTGDFTMTGRLEEVKQFSEEFKQLPHPYKVIIAGNHDICIDDIAGGNGYFFNGQRSSKKTDRRNQVAQQARNYVSSAGLYLQDSGCTIYGYNIWGSPWTPVYADWAFQQKRGWEMLKVWNLIPSDTDILLTHGPPLGYGDLTKHGERAGCVELLNTVRHRVRPQYHIFGHIHEAYGVYSNGHTTFINAANCGLGWRLKNVPVIFDLPKRCHEDEIL